METIVNTLVDYIWGNALVYLALGVGLYFTILTKAVQFRYIPEMIRLLRERKESKKESRRSKLFVWHCLDELVLVISQV